MSNKTKPRTPRLFGSLGRAAFAVSSILAVQSTASAAFVELHLEQVAIDPVGAGSTTWRLYAEFDDPNDQLTRVHGDWPQFSLCYSPSGFYQNVFSGPLSSLNNSAFWAFLPSMEFDSYVTIGGEHSYESQTLSSTGITFTMFENGGPLGFINGEWARPQNDPYAFGEVLSGMPNWHVLVGQFTTYGSGPSSAPFGVLNLGGYRDWFGFNGAETIPWSAEAVPFGTPPEEQGACCFEDPNYGLICEVLAGEVCADLGGYWYGPGTVCSDPMVECEPLDLSGACCYENAAFGLVCDVMIEEHCADLGGYWYGAGTICSDPIVECDPLPTEGACCYSHDIFGLVCDEMTDASCADLGGYWYGLGTVCSDPFVECDPLPENGACCVEEGPGSGFWYCIETTQFDCHDQLGVWYGLGSHCTDPGVNCNPIADCDSVAGSDCARRPQYDDQEFLNFGSGPVAVQTVSPGIPGGRMLSVFDLTGISAAPFNADFPIKRYAHGSWNAANLGSILGLAIDESGNIFVTASQTWNFDVAGPSGWGAVYRIDAYSAAITTFAVLPTAGSSLGSITYDCEHGQFFVSSFEDGLIYRLDYTTGAVLDTFDHGTPWTGNTGPVALGDRPFAVEVNGERLYYSLWNKDYNNPSMTMYNEIWSVQLDATGMPLAGDEVLEISLPNHSLNGNLEFSSPVADMDFSPTGTLVLGERSQIGIDHVTAHQARVLEYECVDGAWVLTSHVFHVGEIAESAAGGVDANEARVWASGDGMHIAAGDNIYGFQGLPAVGGSIADSWLIDYNGDLSVQDKTLLGDLVVAPGEEDEPGPECPIVGLLDIICITAGPPAEFSLEIGLSNVDSSDLITGVSMSVPFGNTLMPANVALNIPPSSSSSFSTVLTGPMPGETLCIELEIVFDSGEICTDTICADMPSCIIIGDFDINGIVNVDDLMILIGLWDEDCDDANDDCDGVDIDGSGVVDMGDLLVVLANWTL